MSKLQKLSIFRKKQGFLPRFLNSYPQSIAGIRSYVEENIKNDPAIIRYWKQLELILQMEYLFHASFKIEFA